MRRFRCYRTSPPAIWPSLDDVMQIHGHPEYGTLIDWLDP